MLLCCAGTNQLTVRRWDGTSWSTVGAPNFISTQFFALVVDNSNTLFLAIADASFGGACSVLRYAGAAGSGWESVGEQGLSYGVCYWHHLAVDSNNVLHFAYQDGSLGMGVSRWKAMHWCCKAVR